MKRIKKRKTFIAKLRSLIKRNQQRQQHLKRLPVLKSLKLCSLLLRARSQSLYLIPLMKNQMNKLIKKRMKASHSLKRCGRSNTLTKSRK